MRRMISCLIFATACDRAPSVDRAGEWSPKDHDQAEMAGRQAMPPSSGTRPNNDEMLVELTWNENCASCHGAEGHGDGPNGRLVKAPDLTRAAWQDNVTDEQIAAQIKNGKGLMPKFDIPAVVVKGLIARIRASKQ